MIANKKVTSLCIIHYGKEYLSCAIQAVYPVSDEIVIVYTATPSHGTGTDMPCPETMSDIITEAKRYDPDNKVYFTTGTFSNEGEQRGACEQICKDRGTDIIVRFDADEVWDTESLRLSLDVVDKSDAKYFGVNGFVNFWKSFNNICVDQFTPIRLINVNVQNNTEVVIDGIIYHFSCAQADKTMLYKYEIHGHKHEIRENWLDEIYFKWKEGQNDVHMTSVGLWNVIAFDKNTLPRILKNHENFNKELIN